MNQTEIYQAVDCPACGRRRGQPCVRVMESHRERSSPIGRAHYERRLAAFQDTKPGRRAAREENDA